MTLLEPLSDDAAFALAARIVGFDAAELIELALNHPDQVRALAKALLVLGGRPPTGPPADPDRA